MCNRARFMTSDEETDGPAGGVAATGVGPEGAAAAHGATAAAAGAASDRRVAVPMLASERKILGDASDTAFLRYVDSVVPVFELRMVRANCPKVVFVKAWEPREPLCTELSLLWLLIHHHVGRRL